MKMLISSVKRKLVLQEGASCAYGFKKDSCQVVPKYRTLNFQNRRLKNVVKVQILNFFQNGIEHVILENLKSPMYNVDEKKR